MDAEKETTEEINTKWILQTIGYSLFAILIVFSIVATTFTLGYENTYCKIEKNIQYNLLTNVTGSMIEYKNLQQIRNTEAGFHKTIYGLGILRISNETMYEKLECKTKYLKEPLTNPMQIREQIFGD